MCFSVHVLCLSTSLHSSHTWEDWQLSALHKTTARDGVCFVKRTSDWHKCTVVDDTPAVSPMNQVYQIIDIIDIIVGCNFQINLSCTMTDWHLNFRYQLIPSATPIPVFKFKLCVSVSEKRGIVLCPKTLSLLLPNKIQNINWCCCYSLSNVKSFGIIKIVQKIFKTTRNYKCKCFTAALGKNLI